MEQPSEVMYLSLGQTSAVNLVLVYDYVYFEN